MFVSWFAGATVTTASENWVAQTAEFHFLTVLSCKSEIKVLAGLASPKATVLGLQMVTFLLQPHVISVSVRVS